MAQTLEGHLLTTKESDVSPLVGRGSEAKATPFLRKVTSEDDNGGWGGEGREEKAHR